MVSIARRRPLSVGLPARFQVLANRNFRLYWSGQLVSLTGTWMQAVAAGWIVLELTGSTFALALTNFASALPGLLLSLFGGVAADRYDRRSIMVVTQAALMAVAVLTGLLVAAGVVAFWMLLVLGVLVGIAIAYDMPAQQALVPDLVGPEQVPQAVALNQVVFNGSRLLGPAIAGVLIAVFGLASAYFANGLSFIAVIASLLLLKLPKGGSRGQVRGGALAAIKDGIRHVWRSPLLRNLMGVNGLTSLLIFPPLAILSPAYVKDALEMGPGTVGLTMGASGLFSMVGAFAMLWVPAVRRGAVSLVSIGVASLGLLVMAWTHNVAVATLAFGLLSLGMGLTFGLNATTVQQVTPGAIRGRVMSVAGMMFSGIMPVAAIVAGTAVELSDIRTVFGVSGVAYLLIAPLLLIRSGIVGRDPAALAG